MNLPTDVIQSLDRMKAMAVVDELRRITEMLQRSDQPFAAQLVANRADNLSRAAKEATFAPAPAKGIEALSEFGPDRLYAKVSREITHA